MKSICIALSLLVCGAVSASVQESYYGEKFSGLVAKAQKEQRNAERGLRSYLKHVLSGSHTVVKGRYYDSVGDYCRDEGNCYRQHVLGYGSARKVVFFRLDAQNDGKGNYVEDVYCHKMFRLRNNQMPSHTIVNIEHTWPQSKFVKGESSSTQKSDLHHLFPTVSKANSRRGSHPFGEVESPRSATDGCNDSVYGRAIAPEGMRTRSSTYFEPADDHKGNVARAMFYFAIRYNGKIDPVQEYYFRKWHADDPVDDKERARNEMIFKIQKNRNPFIDHPYLVDTIQDF